MLPDRYHIDKLRALEGDAHVSYPTGDVNFRRVERILRVDRGTAPAAYDVLTDLEYSTCVLTDQHIVGGDAQKIEIYQAFEDLPGGILTTHSIADSGANQTTTVQRVQPGTVDPEGGLLVIADSVAEQTSKAVAVQTRTVVDEQPLLHGEQVDEATGILIKYTKQIVDAGTTSDEPFHELQPVNKFKSILIISSIDESTLPEPKTWKSTIRHAFPDILTELEILAATDGGDKIELAMHYELLEGYSGPCEAQFTERYMKAADFATYSPPDVTVFKPASTQFFFASTAPRIWSFRTPRSLHGAFTPSVDGITPFPSGGIPATTPTGYSSGDQVLVSVQPEKWRLGVWKVTEIVVTIP